MFLDQVLQKQSLRKEFRAHDLWGGGGCSQEKRNEGIRMGQGKELSKGMIPAGVSFLLSVREYLAVGYPWIGSREHKLWAKMVCTKLKAILWRRGATVRYGQPTLTAAGGWVFWPLKGTWTRHQQHWNNIRWKDVIGKVEFKLNIGEPKLHSLFNNSIWFSPGDSHLFHLLHMWFMMVTILQTSGVAMQGYQIPQATGVSSGIGTWPNSH